VYSSGHPTGQQAWCAPCLAINRQVPGVSRGEDFAGEPLCLGCWGRTEGLLPSRTATADARAARRAAKLAMRMARAGRRARAAVERSRPRSPMRRRSKRRRRRRGRGPTYGRPIQTYAAGLVALRRAGLSRTVLRTREPVWLDMVIDASYESGRASRPGREDAAARLGLSEATITRTWKELKTLGLVDRGNRGGEVSHQRLIADGAVCVCGMPKATKVRVRAEARLEGRETCRWRERAEFDLADAEALEALGIAAEDIEPVLAEAEAAFTAYADRLAPDLTGPVPVVAPPSSVDPATEETSADQGGSRIDAPPTHADGFSPNPSTLIVSRRSPTDVSPSRPAASKPRRRRRGRSLDRDAVGLAERLIKRTEQGGLLPWLRGARVPMLASMLESRGWAHAAPAEVERAAYDQLTRGVHTVPATVSRPVAWLARWLPVSPSAAVATPASLSDLHSTPALSATIQPSEVRRPQSARPCGGGDCSGPTRAVICSTECLADCSGAHRPHGGPGSCPTCG